MEYRPSNTKANCAWCGQPIEFRPIPDDNAYEAGFPWASVADFGLQWGMTAKTLTRTCYDENAHVPTFDVVISREGAANRTADELAAIFILDTAELRSADAFAADQVEDIAFALTIKGWCDDPDDSQALSDLIPKWEGILSDSGYSVVWDDGYQIWRMAQ